MVSGRDGCLLSARKGALRLGSRLRLQRLRLRVVQRPGNLGREHLLLLRVPEKRFGVSHAGCAELLKQRNAE